MSADRRVNSSAGRCMPRKKRDNRRETDVLLGGEIAHCRKKDVDSAGLGIIEIAGGDGRLGVVLGDLWKVGVPLWKCGFEGFGWG